MGAGQRGSDQGEALRRELYERIRTDPDIFEFLQSGSLDGIWYWNLESPEHEWMSRRFWETLGYDHAERTHRVEEWQDLIDPDDLELAKTNVGRHLADPDHPYDQIVRYRGSDGETVWVRCRGLAIRDAAGRPIRMLGAHTDVTALKRTEALLRAKNEQLASANADLEAMAYATSHDIRAPLRTLGALLEMLDEDHGDEFSPAAAELLARVQRTAARIQATAAGIVEFARATTAEHPAEPVDVAEVLAGIAADLATDLAEASAELAIGELPTVTGSAAMLEHVFSNLISNALKFRRTDVAPRIEVSARATQGGWTFAVRDNGVGIPPGARQRLFEPFTRVEGRTAIPGLGLGLAICRRCVHSLGGRIEIDPDYDGGAQFNVTLPA